MGIPRVLGVDRDRARVIVEYFPGADLYSSGPPPDRVEGLRVWQAMASAVRFANLHAVFHCDINPSNVIALSPKS